jgi:NAD(P)-dependent dehydrogenase (short-subunit alcohol dehydrogenase family)
MMMNFSGKVAIVTGGTSGIGQAAAIAYAQQGAKVSRSKKELKALIYSSSELNNYQN